MEAVAPLRPVCFPGMETEDQLSPGGLVIGLLGCHVMFLLFFIIVFTLLVSYCSNLLIIQSHVCEGNGYLFIQLTQPPISLLYDSKQLKQLKQTTTKNAQCKNK